MEKHRWTFSFDQLCNFSHSCLHYFHHCPCYPKSISYLSLQFFFWYCPKMALKMTYYFELYILFQLYHCCSIRVQNEFGNKTISRLYLCNYCEESLIQLSNILISMVGYSPSEIFSLYSSCTSLKVSGVSLHSYKWKLTHASRRKNNLLLMKALLEHSLGISRLQVVRF